MVLVPEWKKKIQEDDTKLTIKLTMRHLPASSVTNSTSKEAYSESSQTSKMELFSKLFNGSKQ